jgi:hypothetical protein
MTRFEASGRIGAHRDSSSTAAGSGRRGTGGVSSNRWSKGLLSGPKSCTAPVGCSWRQ